jgi:glyoxylase-like metal-dependent hydrolase (beta-lactamase superfamily II)
VTEPGYAVRLIAVGSADVRGPEAFWMDRWDDWVRLVFYVVLVQGGGRTILVNTGPPDDLSDINRVWQSYGGDARAALVVAPEQRMPDALVGLGVDPAAVDAVILSPFSAYATGGLHHFSAASILISRHGWTHFITTLQSDANQTGERATQIPMEHLAHLVTDWWPRVRLLEDEDDVAPGIHTTRTGVHDRGSLAVSIATARGTVVYSDSAYHNENIEQRHPIGLAYDLDQARAAYDVIADRADILLAGFDPIHLERYPSGVVA